MEQSFINEFQISLDTSKRLNTLLQKCFPEVEYHGRDYYKQLPHSRILATEKSEIIGQVGIDFRAMNLDERPINVFGVIDLCVDPEFQGRGIGKALMVEFERIAKSNSDKIDFLFLVTDHPKFYEDLGFRKTNIATTWLKVDTHKSLGLGNEKIEDAFFLVKGISSKEWNDGELDLLGFMY